jgi:hypothetical protein
MEPETINIKLIIKNIKHKILTLRKLSSHQGTAVGNISEMSVK